MNTVYTIGHSTRPIDEFVAILKQNGVEELVDIRTVPGSRHNPQYSQEALEEYLKSHGISYAYQKNLGGLRPKAAQSDNGAWRNQSFRNYADYMQTDEFQGGMNELMGRAAKSVVAIMCAEAVPWRCHRSLVGDALLVRKVIVLDIISGACPKEHTLTSFARVDGLRITYPAE